MCNEGGGLGTSEVEGGCGVENEESGVLWIWASSEIAQAGNFSLRLLLKIVLVGFYPLRDNETVLDEHYQREKKLPSLMFFLWSLPFGAQFPGEAFR